jgi:hypothetical protein
VGQKIASSLDALKPGVTPTQPLYSGYRGCFPVVKRSGHGFDQQPYSRTEFKKPLLPVAAFMACYGVTFTFTVSVKINSFLMLKEVLLTVIFMRIAVRLAHRCLISARE